MINIRMTDPAGIVTARTVVTGTVTACIDASRVDSVL